MTYKIDAEVYELLLELADGLDQHEHVKITTPEGDDVYFAFGNRPPVGDPGHYTEIRR